jgi:hypothetical protein
VLYGHLGGDSNTFPTSSANWARSSDWTHDDQLGSVSLARLAIITLTCAVDTGARLSGPAHTAEEGRAVAAR